MYEKFYNLKENPFEITPDPKFLYLSENHREALAHLIYAVRERKGFTVITGEVGTGKTTLIQTLLSRLDGHTKTAYLFNPGLGTTDFLNYICEDFGIKAQRRTKGQCLAQLHEFLMACYARKENVVLIIDEAQKLDPNVLEEIRLLTNLETPKSKLLQVILMGQPELDEVLNRPQFRQLKQRVILRYRLTPLHKEETEEYIRRRLMLGGAVDPDLFTPKALDQIREYSKGIPRLINIVCDNALLRGYASDQKIIGERIIRDVVNSLDGKNRKNRRGRSKYWIGMSFAALCLLGFVFLWRYEFFASVGWIFVEWIRIINSVIGSIY